MTISAAWVAYSSVGFLDLMLEDGIVLTTGRKEPPGLVTLLLEILDLLHLTDLQLSGFDVGEMACDENIGVYKRGVIKRAIVD